MHTQGRKKDTSKGNPERDFLLSEEGQRLELLLLYPYHYSVVKEFTKVQALNVRELSRSKGPTAKMLSGLFRKHSIQEISLAPIGDALLIADTWLQTGKVDAGKVETVKQAASEQLKILRPVIKDIHQSGTVDRNFFGGPLVLAAIGNAVSLAENTLRASGYERDVPHFRASMEDAFQIFSMSRKSPPRFSATTVSAGRRPH